MRSLKELQEELQEAGEAVKELHRQYEEKRGKWSHDEEIEWDRQWVESNTKFNGIMDQLGVQGTAQKVEERLNQPSMDPDRIARLHQNFAKGTGLNDDDTIHRGGGPSGARFRDGAGREIRAYRPQERLAAQGGGDFLVGRTLQALLTGRADLLEEAERRNMLGGVDTQGGYLLSGVVSQLWVDLARSASVAIAAGAQTLPMPAGETFLARVASDPTGYWRAEAVAITASNPTLERITLKAKTLGVRIPISIELLEDAANAPAMLEQVIRNYMGAAVDAAILSGTGVNDPLGIANHTGVGTTTGVGTPTDYSDLTTSVQNILTANYQGEIGQLAWVQHPRSAGTYDGLVEGSTNAPLKGTPWAEALRRFYTTSLTITGGAGSNESISIVGDFSQVLIGVRTNVNIRVLDAGTDSSSVNVADSLQKNIVAYLRADVALLQPGFFNVMSGITA